MKETARVIGRYGGQEQGPLFICTAGMHGNEPAGVDALRTVFKLLDREPLVNPGFVFRGDFVGLIGNLRAWKAGKRFLEKDLNRQWAPENVRRLRDASPGQPGPEDLELLELLSVVEAEIAASRAERVVLLDLHTTSADGGIFAIATDGSESLRIAAGLHAPVILGMLRGINGTTLHYFNEHNFSKPVASAAFEAGQHDDPLSVDRSIAAIINCMRSIGCVRAEDVESHHDEILMKYSQQLPNVAELVQAHSIQAGDGFRMRPGYRNFQPVSRGEVLADDVRGPVASLHDGLILMPLYQPQGSDGFFIVRKVR
ncbi:MAG: succinylglutamate desuccinylase/aspartoacylase family protein [Bacteroidota bacterium]